MIHSEYLLDGVFGNSSHEIDKQRVQLIRILSRSGTLPKVANLQVQYIHSQPEMFLITPGKQLRIGVRLLVKPILALVALRYGIEWQIWYKAIKKHTKDYRVCDLAASIVAAKFIDLLPSEDRKELANEFPDDLIDIYESLKTADFMATKIDLKSISMLTKFHKLESPDAAISDRILQIVELLAIPTESLLMSGGDLRLNIENKQLLNVYGCRPFPRPEAFTFASSTATSVSNIAFDFTQKQREKLINESIISGLEVTYRKHQQELFDRLKQSLKVGRNSSFIISPSGTDISLLFAGLCQTLFGNKLVHILVASDETGSGVPLALEGKHFADTTSLNHVVKKGNLIEGYAPVEVKRISLRDANGHLKTVSELDLEVDSLIKEGLAQNLTPILHVMDQSKLGYAAPSQNYLNAIRSTFNDKVLVIVDNSQLRMPVSRIENYLRKGFLMTITGSKFYTGPPFSGALVLPQQFVSMLEASANKLPEGLSAYYLKSEFIPDLAVGENLQEGYNVGSYLRWYSALVEIERYFRIPITLRSLGSEIFCEHVYKRIANSEFLENLEEIPSADSVPLPDELRTIYPFFILKDGKPLSHEQTDKIYRLLNQDISERITFDTDVDKRIAKQVCHIGQPVKVLYHNQEPSAVLRISLGSRVLSESWKDRDVSIFFQRVESQMNQVDIVVSKIGLILKNIDSF